VITGHWDYRDKLPELVRISGLSSGVPLPVPAAGVAGTMQAAMESRLEASTKVVKESVSASCESMNQRVAASKEALKERVGVATCAMKQRVERASSSVPAFCMPSVPSVPSVPCMSIQRMSSLSSMQWSGVSRASTGARMGEGEGEEVGVAGRFEEEEEEEWVSLRFFSDETAQATEEEKGRCPGESGVLY